MPHGFFEAETRMDFFVSEEVKKMWAVELDLMHEFDRVCKKHDITYYAIAGTLLGAARHKGFIPWDDDMDFGIMWEDFKRLCEIASKEFKQPYFFQCESTDLYAKPDQARLRRTDTTGCTLWEYNNVYDISCNRGIFIDIFPLFNIPDTEEELNLYQKEIVNIWKATRGFIAIDAKNHGCYTYDVDYNEYIHTYQEYREKYSNVQIRKLYLEKCAMFNHINTKRIGITSLRANNPHWFWERDWFTEVVELPFENTTIICPKCYNEKLTRMYGDWQIPVKGSARHEMYIFDPNISYQENPKLLSRLSEFHAL